MDDMSYDYELAPLVAGDPIAQVRPRRARAFSSTDGESGWGEEILGLLEGLRESQPWRARAACAGMPADFWFPPRGATTKEAREVCSTCPVKVPCREYALSRPEYLGTWAGLSERARRQIRHDQQREGDAA